jgi:hypothetical protein
MINILKELNQPFMLNKCDGPANGQITRRTDLDSKVILLSVHGTNHFKDNKGMNKIADLYTGPLTQYLAKITNSSSIINLRKHISISPYEKPSLAEIELEKMSKKAINNIILDLHGAKNSSEFDLFIGTHLQPPNLMQEKLIDIFLSISKKYNLKTSLNHPNYAAKSQHTMTSISLNHGFESTLQIEITKKHRDFYNNENNASNLVDFLEESIKAYNEL